MVIDTSISAVNQTGATCSGLLLDNFSLQPVKLNEVQHTGAAGGCNAPDHHQFAICTNCTSLMKCNMQQQQQ